MLVYCSIYLLMGYSCHLQMYAIKQEYFLRLFSVMSVESGSSGSTTGRVISKLGRMSCSKINTVPPLQLVPSISKSTSCGNFIGSGVGWFLHWGRCMSDINIRERCTITMSYSNSTIIPPLGTAQFLIHTGTITSIFHSTFPFNIQINFW